MLERIKQYIDSKGLKTKAFERSVGLSNGAFAAQLKNKKSIGVDKLEKILKAYPELNPIWVLLGKGEMILPNYTNETEKPLDSTEIIRRLKLALGLPQDQVVAEMLGIKSNTLSSWKRRNSINKSKIISLCTNKGINPDIIFSTTKTNKQQEGLNKQIEAQGDLPACNGEKNEEMEVFLMKQIELLNQKITDKDRDLHELREKYESLLLKVCGLQNEDTKEGKSKAS